MDFVERIFHVSPDHGTGFIEIAIFAALVAVPLILAALRKRRNRTEAASAS